MTTVIALILAAAAGAVAPGRTEFPLGRLTTRGAASTGPDAGFPSGLPAQQPASRIPGAVRVLVILAVCGVVLRGAGASALLAGALGAAVAAAGVREARLRARRREAAHRQAALTEAVAALGAELSTGADPASALTTAVSDLPGLEGVAAAARQPPGHVPRALHEVARRPGGAGAADLAAIWLVAEMSGCALTTPVARVLDGLRARERLDREVAAQLAGPTATAYLLSGLPLVGLALGTALGTNPLGFLLATAAGRTCLAGGVLLVVAGITWTRAITRSVAVEPTGDP